MWKGRKERKRDKKERGLERDREGSMEWGQNTGEG